MGQKVETWGKWGMYTNLEEALVGDGKFWALRFIKAVTLHVDCIHPTVDAEYW